MPGKLTDITERITWFSKVPVNYSFEGSSLPDSIPGSKIPVSDGHSRSPGNLGNMPFHILLWLEVSHGLVISAQETGDLGEPLLLKHHLRPWPPSYLPWDERQHLSSEFVESEDPGSS